MLDSPTEKFGKVMSLPDALVEAWAAAYTDMADEDIKRLAAAVTKRGATARDAKLEVAESIVRRYHGNEVASQSRQAFLSTFSEGNEPEHMAVITVPTGLVMPLDLVRLARPDLSNGALRRLLIQRAVRIDGNVIFEDSRVALEGGAVLRIGPRAWWRVCIVGEGR